VLTAAGVGLIGVFALSAFFNYVYDWTFFSTASVLLAIFGTIGIVFLALIDRHWQFNPAENGINALDIFGSVLLLFAALIIVAMATALSSRFSMVVTLSACIGVFLLGLISDYAFGQHADAHLWARIGRYAIPNLQIFWISDAIYEGSEVSLQYIGISGAYAACYTAGILALAVALFQKRQVG